MISINIEIYANGWKLYRYRHIYIYMQIHMGYKPAIIKICANSATRRNMPSRHSPLMSHQKSSLFGNIS